MHRRSCDPVDPVAGFRDGVARILRLLRRLQDVFVWRLDANQEVLESCLAQQLEQFVVVRDVERDAGRELEGVVVLFEPTRERAQKGFGLLNLADEVVVEEVDLPAISEGVEGVQLS